MGSLIVPGTFAQNPTPFLELVSHRHDYDRVMQTFIKVLRESFQEDARRHGRGFVERIHTQHEEKRRAGIIGKWFRELRGGLGFSLARTLDELPKALRAELDGGSYTPPEASRLWAPGGA